MSKEELIIPYVSIDDSNQAEFSPDTPVMHGPEEKPIEVNSEIVRSETTVDQVEKTIATLTEDSKKDK